MTPEIILIGPPRTGKSTGGKLLAARLARPFADLSALAGSYYAGQGHDGAAARQAWQEGGIEGWLRYQAPFETYAIEHGLPAQAGSVVELGAFQVAVDDEQLFARIRQALQPHRRIFLLLPSPDPEVSIHILDERETVWYNGMEINEHFVRHHSNHDLAKICIYTQGQTPQESCEAILRRLDPASPDIFLIGPIGVGKSTLGALVAAKLGRPQVSLDDIRWDYYREIDYDAATQQAIHEQEGFAGVYRYWKRFEAHAVERALQDHRGCVVDFGAGHSVHEDEADFTRIRALLAPYPNVVLILPSPDLDESTAILRARNTPKIGTTPLTRHLVTHLAFPALATQEPSS